MKIKYECGYCCELFDTQTECSKHESEDCSQNLALKTCTTCKHSTDEMGGTNKIYYGCKKNIIETSPIAYKKNCETWEFDEGYAHTG